jgi:catechol 2,3-dioxygenase-like lactoylglutathione lyase family enzyme
MPLHRLEHVLVLTDDLEATRAFYCDVLGFEIGERPALEFPGFWLYLGGVPCVHVAERASYEAHAARLGLRAMQAPIDHVAFTAARRCRSPDRLERRARRGHSPALPRRPERRPDRAQL